MLQFYSLTDRGRLRENNQDCCVSKQIGKFTVLALADGMGGHKGGEIASLKAIETILKSLDEDLFNHIVPGQIPSLLSEVVYKANSAIYNLSLEDASLKGMGTTLELCIIAWGTAYIAHIGDSRTYRIFDTDITKLTKDHSLVEYMIDTGDITREEAANHPQKNVITRAIGTDSVCEADISYLRIEEGDTILLCSDGLTNMLSEEHILSVISSAPSLKDCAHTLVRLANDAGGTDNISVVLAKI